MKKALFILSLLIWTIKVNAAQVNGVAKIASASDHTGIKVKFIPTTPSAKLDSTLTNADGSFSIDLLLGGYNIEYSFETAFNSTEDVFITSEQTLPEVTLNHYRTISGIISGELTPGIPYHVTDDLTIECGDTLEILPGAKLFFDENIKIIVLGALIANGNEQDSIYFNKYDNVANPNATWGGFIFSGNTNNCRQIRLYNSVINNTNSLINDNINTNKSSITIDNSKIYNSTKGIQGGESTNLTIQNSSIINSVLIKSVVGLINSKLKITNNTLNNSSIYLENGAECIIEKNTFIGSSITANFYYPSTPLVISNNKFITYSNHTKTINITLEEVEDVNIFNNVFNSAETAIKITERSKWGNLTIKGNIFKDNNKNIYYTGLSSSITHNSFSGTHPYITSNTTLPTGLGTRLTVNSNGDSTDFYNNVLGYDPLFISENPEDENFFKVYADSPVINAGEGGGNIGPEGTYNEVVLNTFNEKKTTNIAYPNPTNGIIYFSTKENFQVYNQQGTLISNGFAKSTNLSAFDNGIYLVKVKGQTFKIIKQ